MADSTRRKMTSITIPVTEDLLAALDELAERKKVDRAVLARHLLLEAMRVRAQQGRP